MPLVCGFVVRGSETLQWSRAFFEKKLFVIKKTTWVRMRAYVYSAKETNRSVVKISELLTYFVYGAYA